MVNIASEEKIAVSNRIRDEIQQMIIDDMKPGDKLPPEAELTKKFGASRTSVRAALSMLEVSGILDKRNGSNYVATEVGEFLVHPLLFMIRLKIAKLEDLIELRRMFEVEAAGLAAKNADEKQITELADIVWLMQKPQLTAEEYIKLDIEYHLLVAKASGNSLLEHFIKDITNVLSELYPRRCTLETAVGEAIPHLQKCTYAIKERNVKKTRECMAEHLNEAICLVEQD